MKTKMEIKKEQLIRMIAYKSGINYDKVRNMYNVAENEIKNLLAKANENQDVYVKIFTGITLHSEFIPEKEQINNLTNKMIITKSKIKVKANITNKYREKLIEYSKLN